MNNFTVEIVGDDKHPEGGHVVIRFLGLEQPPSRPEFTIEPAERETEVEGSDTWPKGELKPVGVRQIGETVEFLVGPDIVQNDDLKPGTPVVVGLAGTDLRSRAIWPEVSETPPINSLPTPPALPISSHMETKRLLAETKELLALPERPQRPSAMSAAAALNTEELSIEEFSRELHARGNLPATSTETETEPDDIAEGDAPLDEPPADAVSPPISPVESDEDAEDLSDEPVETGSVADKRLETEDVSDEPAEKTDISPAPADDIAEPGSDEAVVDDATLIALQAAIGPQQPDQSDAIETDGDDATSTDEVAASAAVPEADGGTGTIPAPPEVTAAAPFVSQPSYEWEHSSGPTHPADLAQQSSTAPTTAAPVPAPAHVSSPPAQIVPLEKYDEVRRNSERVSRRFALLALMVALLASATSVYAVVAREGVLLSAVVSRLAFGPDAGLKQADGKKGKSESTLYGTLRAGPLSPQGQKASGVDTKAALQRADRELHTTNSPTDKREAAFWLKHYLVGTIGDARTLWALTQLGTIYADPNGKSHDYNKARMLWELSASMGDPIALCFLGNLHEFGYGVRADKQLALRWYQRAKEAGGCKSLDQAIARVRQ